LYVPVTAAGLGTGVPMRWMVLTCMAAAANPAGCAGGDRVHSHGPVFLWTPSD
jgi:hypothetical protein